VRAGINIKENELVWSLMCAKCRGRLIFPASVTREDAEMKAKTRHGWRGNGREIFCEGCSGITEISEKKNKNKKQPKKQQPKKENDDTIELGED